MKTSHARAAVALMVTVSGCASIAGFDDLSRECPESTPDCAAGGAAADSGAAGNAGSSASGGAAAAGGNSGNAGNAGAGTGAGGSGAAGGADSCSAQVPGTAGRGPRMARIQRLDRTCFWIDTTEVTEGQYAKYLADSPTPSDDALCSGRPDLFDPCKSRVSGDAGSADPLLPKTCVDWCGARDFCSWAGKKLCRDNFTAIGPDQLLTQSDYFAACTAGGKNLAPFGQDCGRFVCNVEGTGPQHAGGTTECYTLGPDNKTPVYDLIGNVEEWTEWCFADSPTAECVIRGGSFAPQSAKECCEGLTLLGRRRATITLGFRCCAEP